MDGLNKDIVRLSLPAIVSNVTVPLLGLCDTAISGHLGSELFLAAIAVGTVMLNVVFWMFGFLRGGTTGLTAIALGEGNDEETLKVLYRGLTIAFGAGIGLIVLQEPIYKGLYIIAGSGSDVGNFVESYFRIRILGSPALLATMAISGWFVGMQSTFFPMIIAIGMNIINIVASFLFVYPFEIGFNGIAFGTLLSNWLGLGISILCLLIFRKGKTLRCRWKDVLKGHLWKYFSVNGNLFLRSFFIICVTMGVTAAGSQLGSLTLAVNLIGMQFFQFFSFFMDGFAFSGEAIIGLRAGEGNEKLLRKSVRRLLQWTFVTAFIFSFIYFLGTDLITYLLTDNEDVRAGVAGIWLYIALIPIISCWAFIFDGFYIGVTETGKMMFSTLFGGIIFFFIVFVNFGDDGLKIDVVNNNLIWIGFLSYLLIRGVYLASVWRRY